MILVFDAGNTETLMGLAEGGDILEHWRFSTRPARTIDELGLLIRAFLRESGFDPNGIRQAGIGSVVPPLTPLLAATCELHIGVPATVIDARTPLPIRLDVDEPMTVGADRILNTLAAARLYRKDTIAVDLGTATTFDCITADGSFLGGVIAPGVQSTAETLVSRTAMLPRVDLERPGAVIGRRTVDCMRSGIFYSAIDSIDGIVRRIREEWSPNAHVVATGGLAGLIGPQCSTVQTIEPLLTLKGAAIALAHLGRPALGPSRKKIHTSARRRAR